MKRSLSILLFLIIIITIGSYNYRRLKSTPQNSTRILVNFGEFNFDSSKKNKMQISLLEIENKFNFISQTYDLPRNKIKVNYHHKSAKKSPIGNDRSYYDGITNTISYYESDEFAIPIIHEYIHSQIGFFKEKWFSEGITVLLHLKAINEQSNSPSGKTMDEIIYETYSCNDNRILCIEKINEELTKDNVKLLFKDELELKTRKENIQFYALSALFCEHLLEHIRLEKLLQIISDRKWYEKSISKLLEKNELDIEEIMLNWISNNFK